MAIDVRHTWGAALAATCDEATSLHLSRTGVGSGWRCLVAGRGTARLARWLAAAGCVVVATDDEPVPGPGAVEVSRRRIGVDPLPDRAFDLAVARGCLGRGDADVALSALVGAVRDGGVVFVEECDWGSIAATTATELVAELRLACVRALEARGHSLDIGRRVPALLRSAGLTHVDAVGRVLTVRGASPALRTLISSTLEMLRNDLLTDGVPEQVLDAAYALLEDPDFDALSPVMVSAWGHVRRPEDGPQDGRRRGNR